jgi:hypothetical protein
MALPTIVASGLSQVDNLAVQPQSIPEPSVGLYLFTMTFSICAATWRRGKVGLLVFLANFARGALQQVSVAFLGNSRKKPEKMTFDGVRRYILPVNSFRASDC